MQASEFMSQQAQASGIHEEVRVPWDHVKASVAVDCGSAVADNLTFD